MLSTAFLTPATLRTFTPTLLRPTLHRRKGPTPPARRAPLAAARPAAAVFPAARRVRALRQPHHGQEGAGLEVLAADNAHHHRRARAAARTGCISASRYLSLGTGQRVRQEGGAAGRSAKHTHHRVCAWLFATPAQLLFAADVPCAAGLRRPRAARLAAGKAADGFAHRYGASRAGGRRVQLARARGWTLDGRRDGAGVRGVRQCGAALRGGDGARGGRERADRAKSDGAAGC
ncbi:hypothetical protein FGB62_10g19 [Gracilaria domingensis]|nr:hypothetical protein FGB62_10g19 [Gracilaria domingensis]